VHKIKKKKCVIAQNFFKILHKKSVIILSTKIIVINQIILVIIKIIMQIKYLELKKIIIMMIILIRKIKIYLKYGPSIGQKWKKFHLHCKPYKK